MGLERDMTRECPFSEMAECSVWLIVEANLAGLYRNLMYGLAEGGASSFNGDWGADMLSVMCASYCFLLLFLKLSNMA